MVIFNVDGFGRKLLLRDRFSFGREVTVCYRFEQEVYIYENGPY